MLSEKEIADDVHGQARSPEMQQFTFSEVEKDGDALIAHWHTLTDSTHREPGLTRQIARTVKATEAKTLMSRPGTGSSRTMPAMKRNILLFILFLVVFAVMFVLESRGAPANPAYGYPRPASTAGK